MDLLNLKSFYHQKLIDECLPFWIKHSVDNEFGGFVTSLDRDGTRLDTDKNVWQQGRFTWLLSELVNEPMFASHPQRETWYETALHGAKFLEQHCFDPVDGRMWFHLDQQGVPIRKRRYAFSESFASIAFGELAQATGKQQYEIQARNCFDRFLSHQTSPVGVQPKFTSNRPTRSIGFPMITIVTAQELRSSIGYEEAEAKIDSAIDEIESFFVKPEIECVMETVADDGKILDHFDGRTLNPGHAIEAAWFILEEARIRSDDRLKQLGCKILDWMFQRGWDEEHGGILYFVDVYGKPVQEYWHDMKFWWPHNEALIASLLAFSLTGEYRYAEMHQQIHDWCYRFFQDDEFGEWFGYLHRDGSKSVTLKGNHWKGPFHYPRMLLTCLRILNRENDWAS